MIDVSDVWYRQALVRAEAEMEGIHFEKKQLTAQWQSSLIATQRRDQALRVSMGNAQTKKGECLCTIQLTAVFGGTCILAYS